jgi:hypothetical protein
MPTILPSRTSGGTGANSWLKKWLLVAYCVFLVAVCSLLFINGPQLRAAANAREAYVADEENRAFCSTLGVGPGTALYAQCARELAHIRARYLQRYLSESIL